MRSFKGTNYLTITPESQINPVDDIGETADVVHEDLDDHGEIDAVLFIDEYEACITCKSKVHIEDDIIAECSKCGTMMKQKRCTKSQTAKVSIISRDGKLHTLTMFNDVITDIIGDNSNIKRALLMADTMNFDVDRNDIVYSVTKLQ